MPGCELAARARWWKWCFATAGYDAVTRIQVSNTVFFMVVPPAPRIHTMPATRSSRSKKNCVLPSKQTTTNKSVYGCVPDATLQVANVQKRDCADHACKFMQRCARERVTMAALAFSPPRLHEFVCSGALVLEASNDLACSQSYRQRKTYGFRHAKDFHFHPCSSTVVHDCGLVCRTGSRAELAERTHSHHRTLRGGRPHRCIGAHHRREGSRRDWPAGDRRKSTGRELNHRHGGMRQCKA